MLCSELDWKFFSCQKRESIIRAQVSFFFKMSFMSLQSSERMRNLMGSTVELAFSTPEAAAAWGETQMLLGLGNPDLRWTLKTLQC